MKRKLEVIEVEKAFSRDGKTIQALRPTSFSVEPGQFVSIIGPSGCGKSTLFNIIAGLLTPTAGQVLSEGESILERAGYVGYMLQKDMLLPWRTILDNVILGLEIRRVPRREALERAMPLIRRYGLEGFENHYPHELSGGMRQRAALLRTLLYDRDILLLDEPFGALDAQTRLDMQNWLLNIWQDVKKTVLFVTHDIDEALYLSDKVLVFSSRPGYIKESLTIALPRPRGAQTMLSPEFTALKSQLLDWLAQEQEGCDKA